jgi:Kef-type K+ transport system membrane component KefB
MPEDVYKKLVEHFFHVGSLEYRNFLRRQNSKSSRSFKLVLLLALIVNIFSFIMFLYITLINREYKNANTVFYFACGLSACSLIAALGTNMILCTKKQKFEPFTKIFKKKLKYMCNLANQ